MHTSSWRAEFGERDQILLPTTLTLCGERTAEDHFEPPQEEQALLQLATHESQRKATIRAKGQWLLCDSEGTAEIPPEALATHAWPSLSLSLHC